MGLPEDEKSSCEVDKKLLRFMDQLELLEDKRTSFNALIEQVRKKHVKINSFIDKINVIFFLQGWFSISKARYSMGNKQVSSLQYANEIEPHICLQTDPLDNGGVKFSTIKVTEMSKSEPVEDVGPQETGVRRRNKKVQNIEKHEKSEKIIPEQPCESQKIRNCDSNLQQDPIKWFGILVPQSLKQAQSSFKQVIELSIDIANLQSAIVNSRHELWNDMEKLKIQETYSSAGN
ncbi:hypothetical protein WMY93_027390 [Mugilogobius chulae]|uniref:Vacuolar ATPase assembly protein VMA22 n=1 Tax=Mugilogobius chulae TaxID=88201 RepID=A0AAW0MYM7_9GOBI